MFLFPVVFDRKAAGPKAMLLYPVALLNKAPEPKATL
jgi:hypothetical protein